MSANEPAAIAVAAAHTKLPGSADTYAPLHANALAGAGMRALCVSIHDVAPASWDECARLADAIREVADIPLTWLVVPHYHRTGGDLARMEAGLEGMLARGDELALHGYTHLDTAPRGRGVAERFFRGTYTHEGEFAALDALEAARRIRLGLDWFAERGWPVRGFVPPAWLMGEGAWEALRGFDFDYTTTFRRFHLLRHGLDDASVAAQSQERQVQAGQWQEPQSRAARSQLPPPPLPPSVLSPSLVYAARNRSGRLASPVLADLLALALSRQPLIRLGLHPPDVRYPRLLHHAQATVARLVATRPAMTKAGFAQGCLTTAPNSHRHASDANPTLHRRMDYCRSGAIPRAY